MSLRTKHRPKSLIRSASVRIANSNNWGMPFKNWGMISPFTLMNRSCWPSVYPPPIILPSSPLDSKTMCFNHRQPHENPFDQAGQYNYDEFMNEGDFMLGLNDIMISCDYSLSGSKSIIVHFWLSWCTTFSEVLATRALPCLLPFTLYESPLISICCLLNLSNLLPLA